MAAARAAPSCLVSLGLSLLFCCILLIVSPILIAALVAKERLNLSIVGVELGKPLRPIGGEILPQLLCQDHITCLARVEPIPAFYEIKSLAASRNVVTDKGLPVHLQVIHLREERVREGMR